MNIRFLFFLLLIIPGFSSIAAQDYSFHVEKSGAGEPVLLIPGLSCSGDVWDETVARLKADYECHVLTLPGFAGQPPLDPMPDELLMSIRDELIRYIEQEGLKQPIIIGHSLGGFLAMAVAAEKPGMIRKLLIVDSLPFLATIQAPGITEEAAAGMAKNMKTAMLNQTPEQYEQTQPAMLKTMITAEEDIQTVLRWGRKSDKATVAEAMYELYATDLRDEITAIEAPMLVLGAWIAYRQYGATRENTLARYQAQYAKAPNARVEMTDKGKHFIMWDDPEFYFEQLDQFLLEQ